ncbi:hypothetical protein GCM10008904_01140 [Paraclostridium ghonii]|uniref:Uncharacterized membrane protein (DUF441 family) n=1 Tax=Paraclostridium ghonii TaxID=29358 RepID=A0ABU0N433_9FIRM|nr:hypothetical protein [Paeniclostridium ghonii]MDQ0557928.1 uncharacterized membrane protein (DUF441 family) [Paeniclostridium ghonii]
MNTIYVIGYVLSFLGVIILLTGFRKDFKTLNTSQKLGITITTIAVIVPMFVGFIEGFINGVMNS